MAEQSWRWVTEPIHGNPDNVRNVLVEGEGPLPGPRVILTCGNIDAEDRDLIGAVRDLEAACAAIVARYHELYEDMDCDYAAFFTALAKEVGAAEAALAKARGEVPDAE